VSLRAFTVSGFEHLRDRRAVALPRVRVKLPGLMDGNGRDNGGVDDGALQVRPGLFRVALAPLPSRNKLSNVSSFVALAQKPYSVGTNVGEQNYRDPSRPHHFGGAAIRRRRATVRLVRLGRSRIFCGSIWARRASKSKLEARFWPRQSGTLD
jgi:hypothetical protein